MLNNTTDNNYPKTLFIRNTKGGMVWQVYHVEALVEAERISANATRNGFESCTLEDHKPDEPQTWEDWRETAQGIID